MIINPGNSPVSAGAKFEKHNPGIIMTTPFFPAEGFQQEKFPDCSYSDILNARLTTTANLQYSALLSADIDKVF